MSPASRQQRRHRSSRTGPFVMKDRRRAESARGQASRAPSDVRVGVIGVALGDGQKWRARSSELGSRRISKLLLQMFSWHERRVLSAHPMDSARYKVIQIQAHIAFPLPPCQSTVTAVHLSDPLDPRSPETPVVRDAYLMTHEAQQLRRSIVAPQTSSTAAGIWRFAASDVSSRLQFSIIGSRLEPRAADRSSCTLGFFLGDGAGM